MESKIAYRDAPDGSIRLPREVYYRCLWTVRDTGRLMKLASSLTAAGNADLSAFASAENSDSAEQAVIVSEKAAGQASSDLRCILSAIGKVPCAYREGLLENIIRKEPFDDFAHPNTWKRWKLVFLHELARELHYI